MPQVREAIEKTIGTTTYKVFPLGAKKGCQVMTRMTKLLGAALKSGAKDPEALFMGAIGELQDNDLEFLCTTFAAVTQYSTPELNGAWPFLSQTFDLHFSANYGELVEWLGHCLSVNFSSFFETAKTALASTKTAVSPANPAPAAA
jgi:hypothetical protein